MATWMLASIYGGEEWEVGVLEKRVDVRSLSVREATRQAHIHPARQGYCLHASEPESSALFFPSNYSKTLWTC